jgi:Family of unknown function (DUF6390)
LTGPASGPALFARYASPPNELGYCGPVGAFHVADSGETTSGVAASARHFAGAWPYLEVISAAAGLDDPLDARVVEAYWVGNDLLDRVDPAALVTGLAPSFADQVGGFWNRMDPPAERLALPHHSFHVLAVYPWVGLLRTAGDAALSVLEGCRIRWGKVVSVDGERATVRSRPLLWDGWRLELGTERDEMARWTSSGRSLAGPVAPGDQVSLHWDWICDSLDDVQLDSLEAASTRQLELTNSQLASGRY